MILATGLSPAWQQIVRLDRLRLGEVNRASETHWCASGKVLNVALALAQLGAQAEVVAPLGGPSGARIERECQELQLVGQWLTVAAPTRVCTTIIEREAAQITELVENAGPLTADELEAFRRAVANRVQHASAWVFSGSLPAGAPSSLLGELLGEGATRAVVDARGAELLEALPLRPLVIKPNREELALTVGRSVDRPAELLAVMRELNERGAQWVVVTQGGRPVYATHAGQAWQIAPPEVEVLNPIGSGDCFAAALAWRYSLGEPMLEGLRWAVAAGAENARHVLPARLDPRRVRELAPRVRLQPVTA